MKRIALVTGSSKGLGLAIAKQLAVLPDIHVIITSRKEPEGRATQQRLAAEKIAVDFHPLDVADETSVATFFAWLQQTHGRLDILVNSAGVNPTGQPEEGSLLTAKPETLVRTFDNNAAAALRVCQAAIPLMRENGYGRIVNVSTEMASLAAIGTDYYPLAPSYRVSKVALNAITLLLGRELRGQNILVNAYSPGWMKTDMGGDSAPFTAEEGAATAVHLATLPDGGPQGGFFAELRKFGGPMRVNW